MVADAMDSSCDSSETSIGPVRAASVQLSAAMPALLAMHTKVGDADVDLALCDASPRSRSNEPYEELSDAMKSESLAASAPIAFLLPSRCLRDSVRRLPRNWCKCASAITASFLLVLVMPLTLRWQAATASQGEDPYEWTTPPVVGAASRVFGSMTLTPGHDQPLHLGGFCFGHSPLKEVVGSMWFEIKLPSLNIASNITESGVYMAVYDDEPVHWRTVSDRWATSDCVYKLQRANQFFTISEPLVQQKFLVAEGFTRHWHFAIIPCGSRPDHFLADVPPVLEYTVTVQHELSKFEPGDFEPEVCPGEPMQYVKDKVYGFLM